MTDKERMLAGRLYKFGGPELVADMRRCRGITGQYNATAYGELELRRKLLKELFKSVGDNIYIEPTFRCDYGIHISIGDNFYANYDCIILDVCPVTIGNNVFFAPRVCLYTAAHPIDAASRDGLLEFGKPITIGDSVWIGGNTVVNPGVTIGSRTIIGSGSIVTKDIPSDVVAAGNPCRVIREITDKDKSYWETLVKDYYSEV